MKHKIDQTTALKWYLEDPDVLAFREAMAKSLRDCAHRRKLQAVKLEAIAHEVLTGNYGKTG